MPPDVRIIAGLILTAISGYAVVLLCAFARMTDPHLSPREWWEVTIAKMFPNVLFAAVIMLFGIWLLLSGVRNYRRD